jgi:hypothetical protein
MKPKPKKKIRPVGTVKVDAYTVISEAVERGARFAANHALKHTDTPTADGIADHIEREVMAALEDVLEFTSY